MVGDGEPRFKPEPKGCFVQLRKYDACWPNDRFPIRKRPLRMAPMNGR